MPKKEDNETIGLKIRSLPLPVLSIFATPTLAIMLMFFLSYTNDEFNLAQYQAWVLLSVVVPPLTFIYLRKYNPEQKLKEIKASRFIANHNVMKYSVFVGMFLHLIITIYNDTRNIVNNPNLLIYDYWKLV